MARVLHLFRAPKRRAPMEALDRVSVVKGAGFEGCAHARPGGKRQVLLVDSEALAAMVCDPCEQIEALSPGLMEAMIGKRGMLCRVLAGEVVGCGDAIVLQSGADA